MTNESPPDANAASALEGAEIAWLTSADGLRLRAAFFAAHHTPRGTVVVLQGRGEFLEKYGEVFARLRAMGYAVAAMDWRGQGLSERQLRNRRKGHCEDFEDYLLDLAALQEALGQRTPPQPVLLLAHSMGGTIALLHLAQGGTFFQRAVLSAPMTGIGMVKHTEIARILARICASIGLSGRFVPGGSPLSYYERVFSHNPLTSDPTRANRVASLLAANPQLGVGDPTIGWVDAAYTALARLSRPDFGTRNRTPLLMIAAGAEEIVDTPATLALGTRMRAASALAIPGARHEIMMEDNRFQNQFWAACQAFFGHAPAPENSEDAPKTELSTPELLESAPPQTESFATTSA